MRNRSIFKLKNAVVSDPEMIWDESLKLQDDRFLIQGIVIDLELTNVLNRLWESVGIIFVNLENY